MQGWLVGWLAFGRSSLRRFVRLSFRQGRNNGEGTKKREEKTIYTKTKTTQNNLFNQTSTKRLDKSPPPCPLPSPPSLPQKVAKGTSLLISQRQYQANYIAANVGLSRPLHVHRRRHTKKGGSGGRESNVKIKTA